MEVITFLSLISMDKRNFGGWCASKSSSDELYYLQVDLGRATTVTGVETQSVHYINRWVQSYTLSYSYDSITWYDYKVDGKGKVRLLPNSFIFLHCYSASVDVASLRCSIWRYCDVATTLVQGCDISTYSRYCDHLV